MMILFESIFWISFFLTGYVYILYPLIITALSFIFNKHYVRETIEPPLSVVITAFNEEKHIASKIQNTLELDYPKDKLEIIVGSDGSTDRTNEIVKSYEKHGVRLLDFTENRGKTMVQNDCVRKAANDIIVFMDAASVCDKDCLKNLVKNFADSRVGVVAGRVEFIQSKENLTTESQGLYWKYEQSLKKAESRLGSMVGVDGPLYAIRRDVYVYLEADIISDLITPLLVIRDGYSVVYEPTAVTYEEATIRTGDELRTRRRIVTRGFAGLFRYPELFNFIKRPMIVWQILSHKILRWLVGLYFLLMLGSSLILSSQLIYLLAFYCMAGFLFLAYYGLRTRDHPRGLYAVPYYFVLVNYAALHGVMDFFRGKRVVSWKPVRG